MLLGSKKMGHSLIVGFFASFAAFATTVVNPGVGVRRDIGELNGAESVEVRSGIVSASLNHDYSGTVKVTNGTLVVKDVGSAGDLKVSTVWTGGDAAIPYTVRMNDDIDWLKVSPAAGTLVPNTPQEFRIDLDTAAMTNRFAYRGVFFVRTTNGLSRPVSVAAETDYEQPIHCERPGETAVFVDLAHPVSGLRFAGEAEYEFEIAVAKTYYFMVRGAASGKRYLNMAVDGDAYGLCQEQAKPYPTWMMMAPGKDMFSAITKPYDLKPGRHRIRIQNVKSTGAKTNYSEFPYDAVVVTDSPESFEQR